MGNIENVQDLDEFVKIRNKQEAAEKHKIVSRQLDDCEEPVLIVHTIGQEEFWKISIREAALDQPFLDGLSKKEADLVKWLYENDSTIKNYNYVENV